jgi:hypothetical protein
VVRCDAVPMLRHSVFKVPRIFSVSTTANLPVVQGIRKTFDITMGPSDRLTGWEPYSREFTDAATIDTARPVLGGPVCVRARLGLHCRIRDATSRVHTHPNPRLRQWNASG